MLFRLLFLAAATVLVVCGGATAVVPTSFVGNYNDPFFDGTLYICVEGNEVHAAYSEIGIVVGTLDGDTVTGTWYQGSYELNEKTDDLSGPFEWTLSDGGFTGTYGYASDPDYGGDWSGTLLGDETPTDLQCAFLQSTDLTGEHHALDSESGLVVNLCTSAEKLRSSYSFTSGDVGYEYGISWMDGAVAGGQWIGGGSGSSLYFMLRNGTLINFWWTFNSDFVVDDQYYETGVQSFSREGATTSKKCKENKDLECVWPKKPKNVVGTLTEDGLSISYERRTFSECEQIKARQEGTDEWYKLSKCDADDKDFTLTKERLLKKLGGEWPTGDYETTVLELAISSVNKSRKFDCGKMKSRSRKAIADHA
eukprot:TRINITY_DN5008_c0_g1_i1.p1 TRINITY_DN5008_c0_g1~~TRINITY_DN5008_c0_g1_i1.p1  ORF type:complete len:366 (+),score=60.01 TRINITY_DN5008_c0_g1_i1:34-1131(+)